MLILLTIAWNDLRLTLRDRGVLANMFVVSVVLTVIVGFANSMIGGGGDGDVRLIVDVIDRDDTMFSGDYLAALREANSSLVLCPMDNDADDICNLHGAALDEKLATRRLKDETSLALIEIPDGLTLALLNGKDASITFRSNQDASSPQYIAQAVESVTLKFAGAMVAARVGTDVLDETETFHFTGVVARSSYTNDVYSRAGEIWAEEPITVKVVLTAEETSSSGGWNGFGQSVPGMGSMYVMFSIFPALAVLIQERRIWTLQRLVTSPVSKVQILGGKVLARMVVGMLQYGIVFAVGALLGVNYGTDPVAIVVVMLAFVTAITALTLAISTFLKTEGQAGGIATFLSLTLTPLGGAWWPMMIVPDWMRMIGHISPVAWAMDAYTELIFFSGSMQTVLVPVAVLLAMAVVFFAVGALRFRYE